MARRENSFHWRAPNFTLSTLIPLCSPEGHFRVPAAQGPARSSGKRLPGSSTGALTLTPGLRVFRTQTRLCCSTSPQPRPRHPPSLLAQRPGSAEAPGLRIHWRWVVFWLHKRKGWSSSSPRRLCFRAALRRGLTFPAPQSALGAHWLSGHLPTSKAKDLPIYAHQSVCSPYCPPAVSHAVSQYNLTHRCTLVLVPFQGP